MKGTTRGTRAGGGISRADVKVCGLCGSLNLRGNRECFVCGWAGAFMGEAASVEAAWRGLEAEAGSVRCEHVSGVRPPLLDGVEIAGVEGGEPAHLPAGVKLKAWWRSVWG